MFGTPLNPDNNPRINAESGSPKQAEDSVERDSKDESLNLNRRQFLQWGSAAGCMASHPPLGGALSSGAPTGGIAAYNLKRLSQPTLAVLSNLNSFCMEQLNGTSLFRHLRSEAARVLTENKEPSATDLAQAVLEKVAEAAERRCSDLSAIASLYGELEAPEVFPEARQFLEIAHGFYKEYCEARSRECLSEVTTVLRTLASDSNTPRQQERQPNSLITHLWRRLPNRDKESLRTTLANNSLSDAKPLLLDAEGFLTPLGALVRETEEHVCSTRYTSNLPEETAARLERARAAAATAKKYFVESTGLDPDIANRLRYQLRHMVAHWNESIERHTTPHLKKLPQQDAQSVIAQIAHSEFLTLKSMIPKVLSKIGATFHQTNAPLLSRPVAAHTPKLFNLAQEEIEASLDDFIQNLSTQLMERHFPSYASSTNPKRESIERQLRTPTKRSLIVWPGGNNWGNDIY